METSYQDFLIGILTEAGITPCLEKSKREVLASRYDVGKDAFEKAPLLDKLREHVRYLQQEIKNLGSLKEY